MTRKALCLALFAVALAAGAVTAPAAVHAADAQDSVPNPTVFGPIRGGVHGYQWNHSLFRLRPKAYHYTEKEYFLSGTATDLSSGAQAPYESRMFVRLPGDRKDFNGEVLVEWLNVTGQMDLETAWPVEGQYLMRHGIGYVGVSAQLAGVCCGPTTLKGWDPRRYAALDHPGDQFSFDIFSQAIQALIDPKNNGTTSLQPVPINPMRRMKPRWIIATGASQSASRLTSFVNGGYNRGEIDLYVITRGGGPFNDFSTPIFQLNEENNSAPQPNNPNYVAWEEAGTAHAPIVWWRYISKMQERDVTTPGSPDAINTACSVNHGSVDYSSRALSHWVDRFLRTDRLPPAPPRVKLDGSGNIVRDVNGLAKGGLRHVFVQLPVGFNTSEGCPLYGTYTAWSADKIRSLYPTHKKYFRAVRRWAKLEVKRGWLLYHDRRDVVRKARKWVAPWTGGCTDSCPAPLGL
jgi:hypothetical protein